MNATFECVSEELITTYSTFKQSWSIVGFRTQFSEAHWYTAYHDIFSTGNLR